MRFDPRQLTTLLMVLSMLAAVGCRKSSESPSGDSSEDAATATQPPDAAGSASPLSSSTTTRSAQDELHPKVLIETSLGDITVELDRQKAPLTVDHFLRRVDLGQYDQTIFHQVFKGYAILGGSYGPDLVEKPSDSVRNEAHNGLRNLRGTIAMARDAARIDSAAAQFFFNVRDNPDLDHQPSEPGQVSPEAYGYCVFGHVVAGQEVVDRIANVPVEDRQGFESIPVETVLIKSIRRLP